MSSDEARDVCGSGGALSLLWSLNPAVDSLNIYSSLYFFKPMDSPAIVISQLFPPADSSCLWNQFACSKNKCIAKQWLCDGENDCEDGLDESVEICG